MGNFVYFYSHNPFSEFQLKDSVVTANVWNAYK